MLKIVYIQRKAYKKEAYLIPQKVIFRSDEFEQKYGSEGSRYILSGIEGESYLDDSNNDFGKLSWSVNVFFYEREALLRDCRENTVFASSVEEKNIQRFLYHLLIKKLSETQSFVAHTANFGVDQYGHPAIGYSDPNVKKITFWGESGKFKAITFYVDRASQYEDWPTEKILASYQDGKVFITDRFGVPILEDASEKWTPELIEILYKALVYGHYPDDLENLREKLVDMDKDELLDVFRSANYCRFGENNICEDDEAYR